MSKLVALFFVLQLNVLCIYGYKATIITLHKSIMGFGIMPDASMAVLVSSFSNHLPSF